MPGALSECETHCADCVPDNVGSTDLSLSVAGDCSGTLPGSRRPALSHESAQRTECGCARGSTAPSLHS